MNMRFGRSIRRASVGAAALFATTAFVAPAAFAAETTADLDVNIQGTTLAFGTAVKESSITVHNSGPQATKVDFIIDLTALDKTKVAFSWEGESVCPTVSDKIECSYTNPIDANETWDEWFKLTKVAGATGPAGSITVTVKSDLDENTANNSKTVAVELLKEDGVDLTADAIDIWATDADHKIIWDEAVEPGAESDFWAYVTNQGTVDSTGQKLYIKLPEHVTFVGSEPDCDYETGDTETTCTYTGEVASMPVGDTDGFFFRVKVDASVAAPVVLGGGLFEVADIPPAGPSLRTATAQSVGSNRLEDVKDIDASDNSDEFSAHVAKKGGQGGGLPVTGTQVSVIAGVGGAAVVGGALLLAMARRRRTNA